MLLVDLATSVATDDFPLAVAVGGTLTDLADAYLIEPSVAERIVVVANAGDTVDGTVQTSSPNGDIDPWAMTIVAAVFRYVQVNGWYPQRNEITDANAAMLPANAFGTWINEKRPSILELYSASDQVSVMAIAFPDYNARVARLSVGAPPPANSTPTLAPDATGTTWHVTEGDTDLANMQFWEALLATTTYAD
jgi:hypothetical protein